jgi:hypothetical protein
MNCMFRISKEHTCARVNPKVVRKCCLARPVPDRAMFSARSDELGSLTTIQRRKNSYHQIQSIRFQYFTSLSC